MNADEIKRLREIAGKATPGPWEVDHRFDSSGHEYEAFVITANKSATEIGASRTFEDEYDMLNCRESDDCDFIAAFNPSTALSLLDRLDALEAEVEKLRNVAEKAEKALRLVSTTHQSYDDPDVRSGPGGPDYRIGVVDGHRCAAKFARDYFAALAALAPSDSSGARKESQ